MPRVATDRRAATVLSRSSVMTMRRVLHALRDGWLLEARVAAAARMVVEDARRLGLDAAGLLVALKREWAALDEVQRLSAFDARTLLNRVISLSIRAYYPQKRPHERTAPPRGDLRDPAESGGARTAA